jgi:hypothetical protein
VAILFENLAQRKNNSRRIISYSNLILNFLARNVCSNCSIKLIFSSQAVIFCILLCIGFLNNA